MQQPFVFWLLILPADTHALSLFQKKCEEEWSCDVPCSDGIPGSIAFQREPIVLGTVTCILFIQSGASISQ